MEEVEVCGRGGWHDLDGDCWRRWRRVVEECGVPWFSCSEGELGEALAVLRPDSTTPAATTRLLHLVTHLCQETPFKRTLMSRDDHAT